MLLTITANGYLCNYWTMSSVKLSEEQIQKFLDLFGGEYNYNELAAHMDEKYPSHSKNSLYSLYNPQSSAEEADSGDTGLSTDTAESTPFSETAVREYDSETTELENENLSERSEANADSG